MNQPSSTAAQEQKRGSERVLLRLPIRVQGIDPHGRPAFSEDTFTLVINRNGARISLKREVRPNDRLMITNLLNKLSCPFRVVGQTKPSMSDGPEWGVECLEPNLDFWGISFPRTPAAPAAEETVDALLECSACSFRELASLNLELYRALVANSSLSRRCSRCNAISAWRFGFAEADTEAEKPARQRLGAGGAASGIENRRAKRITVKLPLRIRTQDGREEIAKTENLSKTGVCFISDQEMAAGETIKLTVGYTPGKNETEVVARVVWRRPLGGQTRAVYGVHLEE